MPIRKSTASAVSNDDTAAAKPTSPDDGLSVEDLNLPKSIVQRLAKGVLPPNTQIQKDALLAMSKSATVFVNYLTSAAAEHAQRSGKKTIMPKDVFDAMTELEFAAMLPRLEAEVNKFTSIQADKRNTYRKKVREEKKKVTGEPGPEQEPKGDVEADGSPRVKRVRRESGDEGTGTEGEGDGNETNVDEQEDEEVEDDEVEEEVQEEGLTEDLLEEKENAVEDDEMADGDESD
ncbi:histone-fold-containing protein [Dothidotthia symphoricarpi CBS 119687]|uniref:DNA polymerase epsilon subunit D n=1 Tax=Dothidotthia symphoricarpi CBS 119687 TaxID=1392245 RepID=A0A6A6AJL8_9PLEO|nr:histone-fold-containing protein [Dothidotthia symphoricarpi CBS 119687]KAF2131423.1 histone-fold-containing protein [Dothidotthia symphoricarpi CBS 119687]